MRKRLPTEDRIRRVEEARDRRRDKGVSMMVTYRGGIWEAVTEECRLSLPMSS